jgi:hypothetical protein
VEGSYIKSCKRWAQQCNSCGFVIAAGSSTLPTLTRHVLHNCKEVDPAAQLDVINQEAAKVVTDSSGAGAFKGVQRDIRTQLGSSKLLKLPASQQQTAAEHFMRFLITSNVSFQAMGNTHLIQGMQVLRPGYEPPSPTTFKTVLLLREYALCISKLHQLLKNDSIINLTVSADCWTDQMRRSILAILVLLPDGTARLPDRHMTCRVTPTPGCS